jgi:hypothetical protein
MARARHTDAELLTPLTNARDGQHGMLVRHDATLRRVSRMTVHLPLTHSTGSTPRLLLLPDARRSLSLPRHLYALLARIKLRLAELMQ